MKTTPPRLAVTVIVLALNAYTAQAQIDYRNLDDDRPTRVTDAVPIERYAFELSLPYRLGVGGGATGHALAPRLEYGILRNVSAGLGLDLDLGGRLGEATEGSASVVFNPRRETPGLPGLALAAEASGTAFDRISVTVGALATRSVGRSRIHVNVFAAPLRPADRSAATEPGWWAGIAWDRTLLRTSTLLVVDLSAEESVGGNDVDWHLGAGFRRQVTPTLVLHGGVARALGGAEQVTRVTVGLSHAFAIAGLMRRVPR